MGKTNMKRNSFFKKVVAIMLVLGMGLSFSACMKKNNPKEITMVLDWTPNTNHTGLYVALEKGYYKEAGLQVSIVQPQEDSACLMVASGQAQFGIDFQDYLTPAFSGDNPLPITAVAAIMQHNTSGIISLKGKGITSPIGMEQHNYATWDLEIEKAILKYLIEKEGGNFDKVGLIPSTVTDCVTTLQLGMDHTGSGSGVGDVDCIWIYYGWDGIATQQAGLETDFFYFKDFEEALDFYSPVIIGNNAYLQQHPEEAQAFIQATKKGYEYAMAHPREAAEILLKYAPELDRELVMASQEWLVNQYQAEAESWGVIDEKRWDNFYQWLYNNGVIKEAIPAGTGYTNDFID